MLSTVENSLWNLLWTCRKINFRMKIIATCFLDAKQRVRN